MTVRLAAENISFKYSSGGPILLNWSATFAAGSFTALTGPSGRGKSTLLYLLGLMLTPHSGTVSVDGSPASTLTDATKAALRAQKFGFVFQDAVLDPARSVLDNVTESNLYRGTPRRQSHATALDLLARFEVTVPPSRKPSQVSGGQAQRIALCRALLHNPPVVLADEPTGNLDPGSAELVVGALREQANRGAAVVIVTHSPAVADACDHVIELA